MQFELLSMHEFIPTPYRGQKAVLWAYNPCDTAILMTALTCYQSFNDDCRYQTHNCPECLWQ